MDAVWCEIDTAALEANIGMFRRLLGPDLCLAPTVKANGYGHGLLIAARAFLRGGADWLSVHSLSEARQLREAEINAPIYIMGPILLDDLPEALSLDLRMVLYNREMLRRLISLGQPARLHLKLETGNHRQGVELPEALSLAQEIAATPGLELEGISSHFANIEDSSDHSYARMQLGRFKEGVVALRAAGHSCSIRHLSNSAAALLWPQHDFEMVRLGISAYGLWPSSETRVALLNQGRQGLKLHPALTWKTRVAQIKELPEGAFIGYGCSFMTTHPTRLAILPVGYSDGYDRKLSNLSYVLINGRRAPLRGRVCMNLIMVDVSNIPDISLEQEVVLMGAQGDERISASQLASWSGSIHYETISRISCGIRRRERAAIRESLKG